MKKLWLISVLSLGLVVFAWCTTNKPVTITSGEDMVNLYNGSKAMTCTLNFSDEDWDANYSMYFKDWMISQVSKRVNSDGEEFVDYALARDGMMYGWWDSYGDAWMYLEYEMDIESELWDLYDSLEGEDKLTCVKWVKDNSVFNKPANIEFASLNDLFWGIEYDEEYGEEYGELEEDNEVVEENVEVEAEAEEVTE